MLLLGEWRQGSRCGQWLGSTGSGWGSGGTVLGVAAAQGVKAGLKVWAAMGGSRGRAKGVDVGWVGGGRAKGVGSGRGSRGRVRGVAVVGLVETV